MDRSKHPRLGEVLEPGRTRKRGHRKFRRPRLRESGVDQAFLIAEMSNSSLILSETSTPPVSSAAFQLSPQSLRSRVAAPSKPMRVLPNGSWAEPVNSKGTVIGLVTPFIVRSPVIVHSS